MMPSDPLKNHFLTWRGQKILEQPKEAVIEYLREELEKYKARFPEQGDQLYTPEKMYDWLMAMQKTLPKASPNIMTGRKTPKQ